MSDRLPDYSPQYRTALVFLGTGTAGAYHAGVLRALHEAGVRIDLVAGRGVGAVSAMFAAVDAGARLWEAGGLWADPAVGRLYPWRPLWRVAGWSLAAAAAALTLPLALIGAVALLYPLVYLAQLLSTTATAAIAAGYTDLVTRLLSPVLLTSVVPRAVTAGFLVGFVVVTLVALAGLRARAGTRRRGRGSLWARTFGAPLDGVSTVAWAAAGFWQFLRGAAPIAQPVLGELARRYSELLGESHGQPGYRELLIIAHDLDARRDLVFAALGPEHRAAFQDAPTGRPAREADLVDLTGLGRDHAMDALAAALAVPVACEPRSVTFAPESYWRGETHRLCDRPAAASRLLGEVAAAGARQVIVVSAAPALGGPHALSAARLGLRSRLGEYLAADEAASVADAVSAHAPWFEGLHAIQPAHNPLGPFDFTGGYDERSDRVHSLRELAERGYEDAYRQFIEPVVGASGEELRDGGVR